MPTENAIQPLLLLTYLYVMGARRQSMPFRPLFSTVDKRLSKADVQDTNIILCPTTQSDYR
jgi:hypothetical protein